MALLASAAYDPAAAVTESTTALLAMTAMDTTNLRLTFNAPANGRVLTRLRLPYHGATPFAQVLLGILESATVKSRVVPMGGITNTALATSHLALEALTVVPGLTPGAALTWDAAYGVEVVSGAGGLKYGGPNDAVTNNAFGSCCFEVYDAPNCLGAVLYDPAVAVSKATSALIAMTAFDTTNARISFVAQTTKVLWRIKTNYSGATTYPQVQLGILDGAAVAARSQPIGGIPGTNLATTNVGIEACGVITGLTKGTTYNYDAAYSVDLILAATNIHYGGPNNTTGNDAWGALAFEIWAV
jgi:hypothetical protein